MITCPYCGTHYTVFQPNCSNCGGILPPPPHQSTPQSVETLVGTPPLPPRAISDSYTWKLLWADGSAIVGLVFLMIGFITGIVGIALSVAAVTAFVGIPLAIFGILFFGIGLGLSYWRYQQKAKVVQVLRKGHAVQGQIDLVRVNHTVEINGVNPWEIRYHFDAQGKDFSGKVTTLTQPNASLREGMPTWVLYLPDSPQNNAIYPHP